MDTRSTLCPVHQGVGKGRCPPSNWPDLGASGQAAKLHFTCSPSTTPWSVSRGPMRRLFVVWDTFPLSHGRSRLSFWANRLLRQAVEVYQRWHLSVCLGGAVWEGYRWLSASAKAPLRLPWPRSSCCAKVRVCAWPGGGLRARGRRRSSPWHGSSRALADGL